MTYVEPKGEDFVGAGGQASTRLRPSSVSGGEPPRGTAKPEVEHKLGWLKAGLSLFLVFHLFCVLLVPNSDNYAGNYFLKVMQPYLYFFEMTNNWNFFAPNPEPPVYVEYELLDAGGQTTFNGAWPDQGERFFWHDRKTRRVTVADFMVNQELGAEKMMVAYLCHRTPAPHAVRIWRVADTVPTPAEVVSGKRRIGDKVGSQRKFVSHTFCEATGL